MYGRLGHLFAHCWHKFDKNFVQPVINDHNHKLPPEPPQFELFHSHPPYPAPYWYRDSCVSQRVTINPNNLVSL